MQHAVGRYDRTSLAWAHESPRGELQDSSTRFRILNDFGKLILSGCLSSLNWNPREHREKNQTCCDAMKQGSDELLDQHGHILDIAQYTFEVPKYAQLATMQHKPKRSELWREMFGLCCGNSREGRQKSLTCDKPETQGSVVESTKTHRMLRIVGLYSTDSELSLKHVRATAYNDAKQADT
jgi:hypothetical protein